MRLLLPIVLTTLVLAACGKGDGAPSADSDLDKAAAVKQLEKVVSIVEAKEYDKLVGLMAAPKGKEAELKERISEIGASLLERQEISAAGVKIIAEKGKFGPLAEIFPDRSKRWVERMGAKVEDCKALSYESAEAAWCKLDGAWKFIRLDDIGKLK